MSQEEENKNHTTEEVHLQNKSTNHQSTRSISTKFAWLNSKLFLLLIGSLMTGILVPWFQYFQEKLEWKRQNQYSDINFKIEMMRDSLKEFVYLSTYAAEAYEISVTFFEITPSTPSIYEGFEQRYIDLQNRRFKQTAKVRSLLIYFESADILERSFSKYVNILNQFMKDVPHLAQIQYCKTNSGPCLQKAEKDLESLRPKIEKYMVLLNESYKEVIELIKQDIGRLKDESKDFRL